ncbi:hypothetical protein PVK06_006091 [Gossypium arboreum]|uniref:Uncharacterized protein n=1 Tax=Gossypium arboreum TaxID=29729 RepID=A0ABR0QXD6_GOSAR|nr:hypothetical protein PVK06_006091 [Gossypium arboreum]
MAYQDIVVVALVFMAVATPSKASSPANSPSSSYSSAFSSNSSSAKLRKDPLLTLSLPTADDEVSDSPSPSPKRNDDVVDSGSPKSNNDCLVPELFNFVSIKAITGIVGVVVVTEFFLV